MRTREIAPFHVVTVHVDDMLTGYDIYYNNAPFLTTAGSRHRLVRGDAYALTAWLNQRGKPVA